MPGKVEASHRTDKQEFGIVKLTKSSLIDPHDTGLQPVVNPPCWASKAGDRLNLTILRSESPTPDSAW